MSRYCKAQPLAAPRFLFPVAMTERADSKLPGLNDDFDAPIVGTTFRRRIIRDGTAIPHTLCGRAILRDALRHQVGIHSVSATLR
jgi:hypothetical protein